MEEKNRFLLIHEWGNGFWSDVSHVAGQLLIAELTDRIPVVFWGAYSLYASDNPLVQDAFTMYFLPVSNHSVYDLEKASYTYYPSRWNHGNLRFPGIKDLRDLEYTAIDKVFSRSENVVVSNVHNYVDSHLISWMKEDHPAYGLGVKEVYDYLYRKYFKLQPSLSNEIEEFYSKNMKHKHPIVGVHIRGNDKIYECPNLHELNNRYPQLIENYLSNNPTASIFLLTDTQNILTKFQKLYGDKLIYTDCLRSPNEDAGSHNGLPFYNRRQKGIDIMKDTYLAMKCDCFIGNHTSNVSVAISRLKAWPEGTIQLL